MVFLKNQLIKIYQDQLLKDPFAAAAACRAMPLTGISQIPTQTQGIRKLTISLFGSPNDRLVHYPTLRDFTRQMQEAAQDLPNVTVRGLTRYENQHGHSSFFTSGKVLQHISQLLEQGQN